MDLKEFSEYVEASSFLQSLKDLKQRMEDEEIEREKLLAERLMEYNFQAVEARGGEVDDDGNVIEKHVPQAVPAEVLKSLVPVLKNPNKVLTEEEKEKKKKRRVKFTLPGEHDAYDLKGKLDKVAARSDDELVGGNYSDIIGKASALVDGHAQADTIALTVIEPGSVGDGEEEEVEGNEGGSGPLSLIADAEDAGAQFKKSMEVGENPVPPRGRGVMMFTNDYFSRKGSHNGLRGQESRSSRHKQATDEEVIVPPVQISGWTFVSLSCFDEVQPPIEKLTMSKSQWGELINHIRNKFKETWVPR